ncbi:teichoic acid biosynthesis protein C [Streptomyces sp. Ru73]|uniref:phage baseplate protein n=1 Tax=Streptomyces sp. Ru73 TaxID=2080748 RepID=UPI000CDE4C5D|nr:teichoic acid biosynthesis protein C [Streptomyces sp. Ru73]POX39453.1 teichoic acid biosynthesis protein C [Streptomyces sp. Ru73]
MTGIGRRELLRFGGAAVLSGPVLLAGRAEAAPGPPGPGGKPVPTVDPVPAEVGIPGAGVPGVPAGGLIDVSGPVTALFQKKRLTHGSVLQSFAFDEDNGYVYALQVVQGGVRLKGESRTYTHAQRVARGDLVLNRLTMSGRLKDRMFLKGFGHGGSLGVQERPGKAPLLWTEWDVNPASGYGRGLARFVYAPNRVLSAGDRGLATFRPQPGTTKNQPAIDMATGRLLLRYRRKGVYRYALYDLDDFVARARPEPLTDIRQPPMRKGVFYQGLALSGSYAYQLTGSPYGPGNPASGPGNARVAAIDLRTGTVVQDVRTTAGRKLRPREPEGLAVLRRGGDRLVAGFTSGKVNRRRFSLYAHGG